MGEIEKTSARSFRVTVNGSPIAPPLLSSEDVTSIQIRSKEGELLFLVVLVPGHPVLFTSSADEGPKFEEFVTNMGFKMFEK